MPNYTKNPYNWFYSHSTWCKSLVSNLAIWHFCLISKKMVPFFRASSGKAAFNGLWLTHGWVKWGQLNWLLGFARLGYRRVSILATNWPKIGQKLTKLAEILKFWKSTPIYRTSDLRVELGTPKNIGFATKNVFLGLEIPEKGLGSQIAPLAPLWRFWRSKWRQIGVRWHFILGLTSGDM